MPMKKTPPQTETLIVIAPLFVDFLFPDEENGKKER